MFSTLGIGDWGLGIGPNPQSPFPIFLLNNKFIFEIKKFNIVYYYIILSLNLF